MADGSVDEGGFGKKLLKISGGKRPFTLDGNGRIRLVVTAIKSVYRPLKNFMPLRIKKES
jgi:hypothetical protein